MKRLDELHSKSQYPSFYLSDQKCNYSVRLTPPRKCKFSLYSYIASLLSKEIFSDMI